MSALQDQLCKTAASIGRGATDPGQAAQGVCDLVARIDPSGADIRALLEAAFCAYGEAQRVAGVVAGREAERAENPALRAFGTTLADAIRAQRTADRRIMDDVFSALVQKGDNPAYAFYQALDAVGGRVP